jgi:hypothetical protein
MPVILTADAAQWIRGLTRQFGERVGDLSPVIVWATDFGDVERPTSRLGVGWIEKEKVLGRFVACDGVACEIAELLPADVVGQHVSELIGVRGDELVFVGSG